MTQLADFIDTVRRITDATLQEIVPAADVEPRRLHEAIRWSLFGAGKRIRPTVLFAVGRTFNAEFNELASTAAAVEMIHTYSLIHDDLPAMDDDDIRRGKATCHKQFGEATAILAGDVLQTLAFKAIADDKNLQTDIRIQLISLISSAAGTPAGMVAGQQLDLEAEGQKLGLPAIEKIHNAKTGAMISASAMAGAIIGAASPDELAVIDKYASKIGLLFQITDDILDVTQASETLGKTAGKDLAAEKATYPSKYGIEKTNELAGKIHGDACQSLSSIKYDTSLLSQIADMILNRKS